jgi:hypothetical protein
MLSFIIESLLKLNISMVLHIYLWNDRGYIAINYEEINMKAVLPYTYEIKIGLKNIRHKPVEIYMKSVLYT